jgi:hypothetical protein
MERPAGNLCCPFNLTVAILIPHQIIFKMGRKEGRPVIVITKKDADFVLVYIIFAV